MSMHARRPPPKRNEPSKIFVGIGAAFAAGLVIIGIVAAYFHFGKPKQPEKVVEQTAPAASSPTPPLVILGITLTDGPLVDPTDMLHISRERVADKKDPADVKLLGIIVKGAHHGKVNLDQDSTSLTYQFLVRHRDLRGARADERRLERVELNLQRVAPQTTKMDMPPTTKTPPEPNCIWNAAWNAASPRAHPAPIAS